MVSEKADSSFNKTKKPTHNNDNDNNKQEQVEKDIKSTPDSQSHNRYKRNKSDTRKEDMSKLSSLKNELIVEMDPTHKDLILNNISNIDKNESDRTNTIDEYSCVKKSVLVPKELEIIEINDHKTRHPQEQAMVENSPVRPEERLHYIAITSIIPEVKLLSSTDDDIMFQSNLKRLLNQKVNNHVSQNFCDRFVICTKNTLKLYKSKEQFLKLSKPVNIIPFSNIKSSNRFSLNHFSNMKLHFFVIEFHERPLKGNK
jgi:hypothetical protein